MSKFDEIKNKAKEKVEEVAEQAKSYDYKGKVEEIKTKATDIADKAKEYDYKAKAEEIKDAVTSYDYKGKAKEVTKAVKDFDYEGKAKEVVDTVKNYDYKAEAENIKKGGFNYFWTKHKKLSIGIIAALILCAIFIPKSDDLNTTNVPGESQTQSNVKYKTKLSDEEITNITIMTFEAAYMSSSSPQFIDAEIIGQDKYGRCAAILEYDLGGIKGRRKFYVFADGLTKDGRVNTNKGIVEESMNNSKLSKSTIEIRKEQFGWNTPR